MSNSARENRYCFTIKISVGYEDRIREILFSSNYNAQKLPTHGYVTENNVSVAFNSPS